MRIHAASASPSVTRTLQAVITASGHSPATADDAELLLIDTLHPAPLPVADTPRLLLGASGDAPDHIACPIRPQQLTRMLAARRATPHVALGSGWLMDAQARSLLHPASPAISLTEKECALLAALAAAHPAPIGRDTLLETVWGIRPEIDTHTLETHIYRLRHKLGGSEPAPCDIVTEGGSYRLVGIGA